MIDVGINLDSQVSNGDHCREICNMIHLSRGRQIVSYTLSIVNSALPKTKILVDVGTHFYFLLVHFTRAFQSERRCFVFAALPFSLYIIYRIQLTESSLFSLTSIVLCIRKGNSSESTCQLQSSHLPYSIRLSTTIDRFRRDSLFCDCGPL